MKKVIPILLIIVLCFVLLPQIVHAEEAEYPILNFIEDGCLPTPEKPIVYCEEYDEGANEYFNTQYVQFIDIIYKRPEELKQIVDAYQKIDYENHIGFSKVMGVAEWKYGVQVDVRVDGGAWHYTKEWDTLNWIGESEHSGFPTSETLNICSYLGYSNPGVYGIYELSDITRMDRTSSNFLSSMLIPAHDGNKSLYLYDMNGHTFEVRMRFFGVFWDEKVGIYYPLFSEWSPTAKAEFGVKYKEPTEIDVPEISSFEVQEYDKNSTQIQYDITVSKNVTEGVLYYLYYCGKSDAYKIVTEVNVNNGGWKEIETIDEYAIDNRTVKAIIKDYKYNSSDNIEVRVKFVVESLNLQSGYSGDYNGEHIGTRPLFISSKWAESEILKADKLGLIPARIRDKDMTKKITRGDFAAVAVKLYEAMSGQKAEPIVENPFEDCDDVEVLKAYNLGIVVGTSSIYYRPERDITREEAATILTRVFKKITIKGWRIDWDNEGAFDNIFDNSFEMPDLFADDEYISKWAKKNVYFMVANGILSGVGNNKFAPRPVTDSDKENNYGQCTIEQAIAISVREYEQLKNKIVVEIPARNKFVDYSKIVYSAIDTCVKESVKNGATNVDIQNTINDILAGKEVGLSVAQVSCRNLKDLIGENILSYSPTIIVIMDEPLGVIKEIWYDTDGSSITGQGGFVIQMMIGPKGEIAKTVCEEDTVLQP